MAAVSAQGGFGSRVSVIKLSFSLRQNKLECSFPTSFFLVSLTSEAIFLVMCDQSMNEL